MQQTNAKYQRLIAYNLHWRSSKKRTSGWSLHAMALMSLQNRNFKRWLDISLLTRECDGARVSLATLPSEIHFFRFGSKSSKILLLPDPITSWIRHFIDMCLLPALFSRISPKKESKAVAKMEVGVWTDMSNFPSMKRLPFSLIGFLIWLTNVDFLLHQKQIGKD